MMQNSTRTLDKTDAPRNTILSAIKNGYNTLAGIRRRTGLGDSEILREMEILEGIEIEKKAGPPVTSFWLKGKAPKGRVAFAGDDNAVEVIKPAPTAKPEIPVQTKTAAITDDYPEQPSDDEFAELPCGMLDDNKGNPRGAVNTQSQEFLNLVESIKLYGIKQPLRVKRKSNGRFTILIGHRRRKAAEAAGLEFVPCIIQGVQTDADDETMLIENIQREDLSPMQQARAFYKLFRKHDKDIHAVARLVCETQSYVAQKIRLLKLDDSIQRMVDEKRIGESRARMLAGLEINQQKQLVSRAVRMKIEDLKILVNDTKNEIPRAKRKPHNRVTSDNERFTRKTALAALERAGETYFPARFFKDAFDDVCLDICDAATCADCPAPRLIEAMLRHKQRGENNAE